MKLTRIAVCPFCHERVTIPRRGYSRGAVNHMGSSFECTGCHCRFKTR